MMTKKNVKAIATLAWLLSAGLAQAQSLNPWNAAGDVLANGGTIQLSTAYDADDAPGPLSGSGALDRDVLEPLIGLSSGALDLSADEWAAEGSLVYQSFSAVAGQSLSFDWNFATLETSFQDRAFVVLDGQVQTLTTASGAASGHFSQRFDSAATFQLAVGVVDTGDYTGTSTLALSNIALSAAPVPEPATVVLLMGGLGLVMWRSRRRRD